MGKEEVEQRGVLAQKKSYAILMANAKLFAQYVVHKEMGNSVEAVVKGFTVRRMDHVVSQVSV